MHLALVLQELGKWILREHSILGNIVRQVLLSEKYVLLVHLWLVHDLLVLSPKVPLGLVVFKVIISLIFLLCMAV